MRTVPVLDRLVSALGRLFVVAIFAVFVTFGLHLYGLNPWAAWSSAPAELARERLDAEQHVAEELGFHLDRVVSLPTPATAVPIDLHAGECVAVIASVWGAFRPDWLVVAPTEDVHLYDEDTIAAHVSVEGLVAHVQFCAVDDSRAWAVLAVGSIDYSRHAPLFVPGELRILRAPLSRIGSPERLDRGWTRRAPPSAAEARVTASADVSSDAVDAGLPDGGTSR